MNILQVALDKRTLMRNPPTHTHTPFVKAIILVGYLICIIKFQLSNQNDNFLSLPKVQTSKRLFVLYFSKLRLAASLPVQA